MARQKSMNPVPYIKHMEAYNDFSGGLNTVSSSDNLKDNELTDMINVDLAERGPAKRRTGMKQADSMYRSTRWSDLKGLKWSDLK